MGALGRAVSRCPRQARTRAESRLAALPARQARSSRARACGNAICITTASAIPSPRMPIEILLTGASGFIGSHLRQALAARGGALRLASRHRPPALEPGERWLAIDFGSADAQRWRDALAGVDVVVNTVGILREHGAQTFEALHVRGARALFDACAAAGVRRVVHVSAL